MTRVQLKLKSFDFYYINLATNFLQSIFIFLNIDQYKQIILPSRIKKITVLRSPHIDKKSREQFQIKKYKKLIYLDFLNEKQSVLLLSFLKNSELIGIELEIRVEFLDYLKI